MSYLRQWLSDLYVHNTLSNSGIWGSTLAIINPHNVCVGLPSSRGQSELHGSLQSWLKVEVDLNLALPSLGFLTNSQSQVATYSRKDFPWKALASHPSQLPADSALCDAMPTARRRALPHGCHCSSAI
jgi:hypothetical protein